VRYIDFFFRSLRLRPKRILGWRYMRLENRSSKWRRIRTLSLQSEHWRASLRPL